MKRRQDRAGLGWGLKVLVAAAVVQFAGVMPVAVAEDAALKAMRDELRQMREAYEGRIAQLESQVQVLTQQTTESRRQTTIQNGIDRALGEQTPYSNATASVPGPRQEPVRDAKVVVGGYSEFTYIDRGEKTAQFDQLRTVLEFSAQLHERIKFYSEWEWEHGGTIEDGETDGELELEQAYVDLLFHDKINFRAGVILVPLGRYNLYHEAWANNLVDRPLIDRYITPTTWSEEGVGFHGQALDSDVLGISYEAYLFNAGRASEISAGSGFRGVRNNNNAPAYDTQKAGAFRVAFEPARSAHWFADTFELGFSGYVSGFEGYSDDDAGIHHHNGQLQIWALDWNWERGNWGLRGEAAMASATTGAVASGDGQQSWGYSVEAFYQFWPGFLTRSAFGRAFTDPKLTLAFRYDWVDLDLDRFDQRDMGRVTVGLSYRPTPRAVYKFDYQIDHSPSSRDATTLSASGRGKNTDAFLFSVSVGF